MRGDARLGAAYWLLLLATVSLTQAGPVNRLVRVRRDEAGTTEELADNEGLSNPTNTTLGSLGACTVGDIVYQIGENVPSSGPCVKCTCTGQSEDGTGVICQTVQCEVRAGCKALHRADHCCPLYQCECERNGTLYSNGEKLEDPDNPCQVCYCQGGEIVCNQIACFRRNDCEPVYVPGSCCPEYDHCPPSDKDIHEHSALKESSIKEQNTVEKSSGGPYIDVKEKIETENVETESTGQNNKKIENNESQPNMNKDNIPKIYIKEVYTQNKPFNNEIRIKEVLPATYYETAVISTKAPLFPRETSYINDSDGKPNDDSLKITDIPEESNLNDDGSQPPPVLRIGDQLLYLKLGDLVPENAAVSTPSSVFTVIGAEGLQRVFDEPEEQFENKNSDFEPVENTKEITQENVNNESENTKDITQENVNNESEKTKDITQENVNNESENALEKEETQSEEKPTQVKRTKNYLENDTESEGEDKNIQDTISESYETTTIQPMASQSTNELTQILFETNDVKIDEPEDEETINQKQPQLTEKSSVDNLDDEPQPVEHLPEHNPEYPPIPEDIMILSMTEDSLDSGSSELEFSGASPIGSHEMKDDEKIVIVKRPVIPLSTKNKNTILIENNPVKILPDILPEIRKNKTDLSDNGVTFAPEEWLKSTQKPFEFNSPLLTLESALPDSLLTVSSKSSSEEDDSKEYIFVSNDTLHAKTNDIKINRAETSTDDTPGLTDAIELEGEFRSPGEPYLIPEWERNQTTDEPEILNTTEYYSLNSTMDAELSDEINEYNAVNITARDNNETSNEIDEDLIIVENTTEFSTTSSDFDSTNVVDSSSPAGIEQDASEILTDTDLSEAMEDLKIETSSKDADDTITNFIISTENPLLHSTTENFEIKEILITEKPKNLLGSEFVPGLESKETYDENVYPQKQKKTSATIVDDKNDDTEKKGNILADLINLVGDVASIGNHDVEVSTVLNSLDSVKSSDKPKQEKVNPPKLEEDYTIPFHNMVTNSDLSLDDFNVELTEYNNSGDKMDPDIPLENEKVEFTTKKIFIDKDSDERNIWKSTDEIADDIEIIPKVEQKGIQKNPAHEKIIKNLESLDKDKENFNFHSTSSPTFISKANKVSLDNTDEDVIIYTAVQVTTELPNKIIPTNNTLNKMNSKKNKNVAETLISIDDGDTSIQTEENNSGELETTENSYTSTIMKVVGKNSNMDEQMSALSDDGKDKLTKRETNSQLLDSTGQIDDNLLNILRGFFEQHFNH